MSDRKINVGKVRGLSSYELAIQSGKFTGTLEDYVNKEQLIYDNMVQYGDDLKEYFESNMARTHEVTDLKDIAVVRNMDTMVFTYTAIKTIFLTVSAYVKMTNSNSDTVLKLKINGEVQHITGITSSKYMDMTMPMVLEAGDKLELYIFQNDVVSDITTEGKVIILGEGRTV